MESLEKRANDFAKDTELRRQYEHGQGDRSQLHGPSPTSAHSVPSIVTPSQTVLDDVEAHNGPSTMGSIGHLELGAMAEPLDRSPENLPKALTMEALITAALGLSGADPSKAAPKEAIWGRLSHSLDSFTSTRISKLSEESTREFFESAIGEIAYCLPFLERHTLWEYFQEVLTEGPHHSADERPTTQSHKAFVVYILISTGIYLSPTAGHLQGIATELHARGVAMIAGIASTDDKSVLIYCMLLLVIHSIHTPRGGSTWHLAGLVMRKCIAVRMHRGPNPSSPPASAELDSNRWLFWAVYVVERQVSSLMDRPYCIQDADITTTVSLQSAGVHHPHLHASVGVLFHLPCFLTTELCRYRKLVPNQLYHKEKWTQKPRYV